MRPFSALRYDPAVAGPLDDLVAPPYDVIDGGARSGYLARSPYNVVHLTLPETPEQASATIPTGSTRPAASTGARARLTAVG